MNDEIEEITEYFSFQLQEITEAAGLNKLFIDDYPDFYRHERKNVESVTFSLDELEILHNAINMAVEQRNQLKDELEDKSLFYIKDFDDYKTIKFLCFKINILKNK